MLRRLALANSIRPVAVNTTSRRVAIAGRRFYSEEAAKEQQQQQSEQKDGEAKEDATAEESGLSKDALEWKAKYEAKDKEAAQLKDKYQRSVADFRNLQESTKRQMQSAKDFALQKFAKDLLESVDNFDRALSVVPEDKQNDHDNHKELAQLFEGIKMTQDVFEKTLAKHGLVKVNPLGEKFDPNVHEATFEVPQPDKEPGTVFHVQQTGFSLNNRVLRAPKVGVVKGSD